ncbi:MAG: MBOAT family protein, partial [Bacteroidota bacterium]|nr:MBOAT family protein [Bacteroidota bacterium]
MEFHSSLFLTLFLPIFLALYFLADKKYKNKILLIASIIFYSWGEPKFIFVLLFTTVLDFYLVKKIHTSTNSKQRILYLVLS